MTWSILLIALAAFAIVFWLGWRAAGRPVVDHLDDFEPADHRAHWSMRSHGHHGDTRRRSLLLQARQRDIKRARQRWNEVARQFNAVFLVPTEQAKKELN